MDQTKEEYVAAVVASVLPKMPTAATDEDRATVAFSAEAAWNTGCTVLDAIRYAMTFEEVDPDLAEERAFAIRRVLAAKYMGKHRATPSETNFFIR